MSALKINGKISSAVRSANIKGTNINSKTIKSILRYIILSVIAVFYITPLLIIFTNSLMSQNEITRNYAGGFSLFDYAKADQNNMHYAEYKLIPENVTLEQYDSLFFKTPKYMDLFLNSIKLTIPIVVLQLLVGSLAAYGFTVNPSRQREIIFCIYIIIMILPYQATLVPNYIIADKLGILNSYLSIILPGTFHPFAVFIMRQSMKQIPADVLNAAAIDGASHFKRFIHIVVPMSKSGVASLFILSFIDCWGMVEQPLVFIKDSVKEPLSVFLSQMSQDHTGLIFAASFFYMIPAVWVFLYGLDDFKNGVKLSAFK